MRYTQRSNSTKGERVCVCVLVRVVRRTTPGRSTNTQQRCGGYGYYTVSKNVWLTSSPLAPRLEDEPWLWEVSAAPPEDAFSLLHASLLLSAITRASSCCRASCGAHRTNTGEVGLVHEQREKENAAFQRRVDSRSLVSCVTRKSLAEVETRLRVLALILAVLNILSTTAHAQGRHSRVRHSGLAPVVVYIAACSLVDSN